MALEGTLRDFSLADIFQLIGLQRKTGVLTLSGGNDVVTVSFLDGMVVSADSLQKKVENRLGNMLVKTSRISSEDLERALTMQRKTLQRLGTILVEMSLIERDELKDALQTQVLQTVYRLFRWADGDYKFSQEQDIEYDREHITPVQAESILMEGARMIDEWPIIERRIHSFDMIFAKLDAKQKVRIDEDEDSDDLDFDLGFGDGDESDTSVKKKPAAIANPDVVTVSPAEGFVYDLLDGRMAVAELIESSRYKEFDTVKAVYDLLARGLIEELKPITDEDDDEVEEDVEEGRSFNVPGTLAVLGILSMLVLSLLFMRTNPANVLTRSNTGAVSLGSVHFPPRLDLIVKRSISAGRLERLATAVETLMLVDGQYPDDLTALTSLGLIDEGDTTDPWGAAYHYDNQFDRYYLIGYQPNGDIDTGLFISKSIDSQSSAPISGKSVILLDPED